VLPSFPQGSDPPPDGAIGSRQSWASPIAQR